jgi:hypothetical protein
LCNRVGSCCGFASGEVTTTTKSIGAGMPDCTGDAVG